MLIMSDGVHDNLDPMSLGKLPKDIGFPAATDWKEVPDREKEIAKDAYMLRLFGDLVGNCATAKASSIALVKHALAVTQSSRCVEKENNNFISLLRLDLTYRSDFMKANPKSKLPSNYQLYPGKMDHTSCIGLRVGGKSEP